MEAGGRGDVPGGPGRVVEVFDAHRQPKPPEEANQEPDQDVLPLVGEGRAQGQAGLVHYPRIGRFLAIEAAGENGLALPLGQGFEEGILVVELDPQAVVDERAAVRPEGLGPDLVEKAP